MKINVNKVCPTPKDKWEAVDFANEAQQKLLEALYIMDSVLKSPQDFEGFHKRRMEEFIKQYQW